MFNRSLANKSFQNFEMCVEARLAGFNLFKAGTNSESLILLMLQWNADLEDCQRISTLLDTVGDTEENEDGSRPTNRQLMSKVKQEPISPVLSQCDKSRSAH